MYKLKSLNNTFKILRLIEKVIYKGKNEKI